MENKLGRKSMQEFMYHAESLVVEAYQTGFKEGYDKKSDETPTMEDLTNSLMDQYTDGELEELAHRLDGIVAHGISKRSAKSANEQRAELIQRAREFVVGYKNNHKFGDAEFYTKNNRITCLFRGG